jgi:hypothetical protein
MLMHAVDEVAPAALRAPPAVSTEIADPDALPDFPARDARPKRVEAPDRFVPWNPGEFSVGQDALYCEDVRVADATGLHADANVTGLRIDKRALPEL